MQLNGIEIYNEKTIMLIVAFVFIFTFICMAVYKNVIARYILLIVILGISIICGINRLKTVEMSDEN